jgi:hypothetical protein
MQVETRGWGKGGAIVRSATVTRCSNKRNFHEIISFEFSAASVGPKLRHFTNFLQEPR